MLLYSCTSVIVVHNVYFYLSVGIFISDNEISDNKTFENDIFKHPGSLSVAQMKMYGT